MVGSIQINTRQTKHRWKVPKNKQKQLPEVRITSQVEKGVNAETRPDWELLFGTFNMLAVGLCITAFAN